MTTTKKTAMWAEIAVVLVIFVIGAIAVGLKVTAVIVLIIVFIAAILALVLNLVSNH